MIEIYDLEVRRPITVLDAVIDLFCGNARMSLDGDLSKCNARNIPIVAYAPIGKLEGQGIDRTVATEGRFIVFPLEESTIDLIKRQVLPKVGLRKRINHIQIEKDGKLVFGAFDIFYPGLVRISGEVSLDFLEALIESKGIWKYKAVEDSTL